MRRSPRSHREIAEADQSPCDLSATCSIVRLKVPEDERQPAWDEEAMRGWALAVREKRLAVTRRIARDQDELLRSKADQLERAGAVEVTTASGVISARITRFRWGDDVIEISRSHGEQCGWSLGRLARSPSTARAAALTRHLAAALAALEPATPPPAVPRE